MIGVFHRGDVIRKLRESQGWSQAQLAKRASLHISSIQRAESNRPDVSVDTFARIAGALSISVDFLTQATADVTPVVNPASQTPVPPSPLQESSPMSDTPSMRARLIHTVQGLDEAEAALLLPLVRQWTAEIERRRAEVHEPTRSPKARP